MRAGAGEWLQCRRHLLLAAGHAPVSVLSPLVSIVTPVFNQGDYLEATMLSVLAQDYPTLEYIVINDGSTDNSLAVARAVAAGHPGRVTIIDQPNAGQASALNHAWSQARGEVLAYLSSDDCLLPDAVSRSLRTLQARPDASVVYCDFHLIDANGRRMREVRTEDFDAARLTEDLVCQPGPGAFFRRRVFDETGGWQAALSQVPDFEFWLRAHRFGPFVRVPVPLAEYRIHEASASFRVTSAARAQEILDVVTAYWEQSGSALAPAARRAEARARTVVAKNHAQSGRAGDALTWFASALRRRPALALEPGIWRQLLVGFARRTWYQRRTRWGGGPYEAS